MYDGDSMGLKSTNGTWCLIKNFVELSCLNIFKIQNNIFKITQIENQFKS